MNLASFTRALRGEPNTKFLVFTTGEEPPLEENWLLNLELTDDVFYADQDSLWLSELGLSYEYNKLTTEHSSFFTTQKRRNALKKLLSGHDSMDTVPYRILAVITGADCRLDAILEQSLAELGAGEATKYMEIQACHLDTFLWKAVQKHYGYIADAPSVKDFAFRLFQSCYLMTLDSECSKSVRLNDEALVFLKRFKDSRKYGPAFEQCSQMVSAALEVESDLAKRKLETLGDLDFFKQIDIHILTELVTRVKARTISAADCSNLVRARRQTFWYERLAHAYFAIDMASRFLQTLGDTNLAVNSLTDGFRCYTVSISDWINLYRKFIYHARSAEQNDLLRELQTMVENFYSNRCLLPLNNLRQEKLDSQTQWIVPGIPRQDHFFADNIQGILDKGKKVFVIISDALRYEAAEELGERIPAQFARENARFVFNEVRKGARAKDLEDAMRWLVNASMIFPVPRVEEPALPLKARENRKIFKLYTSDAGMLRRLAELPPGVLLNNQDVFSDFKGRFAENFVAQQFQAMGISPVCYWANSTGRAEVDFLIQWENAVVPVEVKSGLNLHAQSLQTYRRKYSPEISLRISMQNLKFDAGLLNLPLYLLNELPRLMTEAKAMSCRL